MNVKNWYEGVTENFHNKSSSTYGILPSWSRYHYHLHSHVFWLQLSTLQVTLHIVHHSRESVFPPTLLPSTVPSKTIVSSPLFLWVCPVQILFLLIICTKVVYLLSFSLTHLHCFFIHPPYSFDSRPNPHFQCLNSLFIMSVTKRVRHFIENT